MIADEKLRSVVIDLEDQLGSSPLWPQLSAEIERLERASETYRRTLESVVDLAVAPTTAGTATNTYIETGRG